MKSFLETRNLSERLFGEGATDLSGLSDDTARFLHVIEHGVNWSAPEGHRSSYDFAQRLDFQALLRAHPQVPARYLEYTVHWILDVAFDQASLIAMLGGDDSLADAGWVWDRIVQAAAAISLPLVLDKKLLQVAQAKLAQLRGEVANEVDEEEADLEEIYTVIDAVGDQLGALGTGASA